MAEVKSLCHICGKVAVHACSNCGRPACGEHYDSVTGFCSSCKRGRMMKK